MDKEHIVDQVKLLIPNDKENPNYDKSLILQLIRS